MDGIHYFLCFPLIIISFFSSPLYAEDMCVRKTACSCEFSNGTGIDLSESAKSSFYAAQNYEMVINGTETTQYKLNTYYYHPCFDATLSVNASTVGSSCDKPLTICRHINVMQLVNPTNMTYNFTEGKYEYIGSSIYMNISDDGKSMLYNNGPSNTHVILVCAETADKLEVTSTAEPNDIILTFYSKNACLRQLETIGRSTGSTLLIVFFSLVIFYLVLGVCTKKFLMGATGIEVVPNLAFWSDLPNLVRDGWAFTLNGFKLPARGAGPVTSPDPNSYDSI